ncbi:MAG: MMPL family transporter [Bacteroidales bacterium]|nr:MMPL family transporter [Bacteroidales bacterium]
MSRKGRNILLALMTVLTAGSLLLIPRININEDMTRYLPDSSRMKHGVDSLKACFPEIDMNACWIRAMFYGTADKDSLAREIAGIEGVGGITSVEEKDSLTLFQLSVGQGADTKAVASAISAAYGDTVVVEHNANSIMPENMGLILMIGSLIVFGILFLMCSSFVEALLFILTIGMAVILNMGTNALLPSVSMMTNTIVAVLQLVLSMDYSIILMNRFRQVTLREPDTDKAMTLALKAASPSILSSGLTTIVGLLALLFMKFKIGMDLGIVLAKGVFLSLVSIYTILPALVLLFYKGIKRTSKKVFFIPTDRLAEFELKFRIPLAVLFVVVFAAAWMLSGRTELSYASIWESKINEEFPPKNAFSLLYRTSSEDKVIDLSDSISADSAVVMTLSYPSIFKKQMTAGQVLGSIPSDLPFDLPFDRDFLNEDVVRFLFYSATHPERDEKMSLEDMIALAQEASRSGLLPEGMDVDAIMEKFTAAPLGTPVPAQEAAPEQETTPVREIGPQPSAPLDAAAFDAPSIADKPADEERPEEADDPFGLRGKYNFSKDKLNTQMSSAEIADYLGFSRSQSSAAFAMAKKRNATMTPYEFISYMIDNVLSNKVIGKMVSREQAEGLYYIRGEMDKALAESETPRVQPAEAQPEPRTDYAPEPQAVAVAEASAPVKVDEHEPDPMERLAEMFASEEKYSSGQIYRSLRAAGIDDVDEAVLKLMYAFYGSRYNYDDGTTMSLEEIVGFLSDEVALRDEYAVFLDDSTRTVLGGLKETVGQAAKMLRKDEWSMAAIVTDYPVESEPTFSFVEKTLSACDEAFGDDAYYLVGESVMYKEMKDGFRRELLLLTLLTVISIFLIVALTFKSALIPTILVMTVLTGVNINVIFSGLGGHTMLYLAYLIVQSILIGSTIDYGILFTNYYLDLRRTGQSISDSLKRAYRGSIHTIMTSGLIIILAPFIMARLLTDPTICSILQSLTFGALAVIILIIFVLPALLAAADKVIK